VARLRSGAGERGQDIIEDLESGHYFQAPAA
jgi:hypothetical protein